MLTSDARYFTAPARQPWVGRERIVPAWLERRHAPDEWTFRYELLGIDQNLGFVRGGTQHLKQQVNLSKPWVVQLTTDGFCEESTQWFMEDG